jgi:hypothetical protein
MFEKGARLKRVCVFGALVVLFGCLNVVLFGTACRQTVSVDLPTMWARTTEEWSILGIPVSRDRHERHTVVSRALFEHGSTTGFVGEVICIHRRWKLFSEITSHGQMGRLIASIVKDPRWYEAFERRPAAARAALSRVIAYALTQDANGTGLEELTSEVTEEIEEAERDD